MKRLLLVLLLPVTACKMAPQTRFANCDREKVEASTAACMERQSRLDNERRYYNPGTACFREARQLWCEEVEVPHD